LLVREILYAPIFWRRTKTEFWALRGVSFEVGKGETVGIIGKNGAGKSTLLKMLCGVTRPTEGTFKIEGRISALLEIGAGFHSELTGRENVYLNGSILGIPKKEIDAKFGEIVDFAEIHDFIESPVKTYSTGMFLRLGFAVAVNMDPDILVIDEVLAVGDLQFQKKCIGRIKEFQASGKTILFISHDINYIRAICDTALYLKEGTLVASGDAREVVSRYTEDLEREEAVVSLRSGGLEVVFEDGKLSLVWQGRPLTGGPGMYSTFLVNGHWHESVLARWEVIERKPGGFMARGRWQNLPLVQEWSVRMERTDFVKIDINTEILESLQIENASINLMLDEGYRRWEASGESGDFPREFALDWQKLKVIFPDGGEKMNLGVLPDEASRAKYPAVSFALLRPPEGVNGVVHNSERSFMCRNLHYALLLPPGGGKIDVGKYTFFNGSIEIAP